MFLKRTNQMNRLQSRDRSTFLTHFGRNLFLTLTAPPTFVAAVGIPYSLIFYFRGIGKVLRPYITKEYQKLLLFRDKLQDPASWSEIKNMTPF